MTTNRILNWEGCNNVRDLGGMDASNGSKTRWGAIVRGDHPANLTERGWSALYEHGIRTIISLRTDGVEEDDLVLPDRLDGLDVVALAIEDLKEKEFLETWAATDLPTSARYDQRWPWRSSFHRDCRQPD